MSTLGADLAFDLGAAPAVQPPFGTGPTTAGDGTSPNFGADVSTWPDLDGSFALITGKRVVAEAALRRLMTPRGALVGAPNYGLDLRGWVNASYTPAQLGRLQADIAAECEKDERVRSADVTVTADTTTMSLTVQVALDTNDGPFGMTLLVTAVSILPITTSG